MDYQAKTDWSYNDTVTEQDMNRIEAGLGDLHERLDVDSYEQLTLKPGLQIVNAKKNSPFQLTGLKGRTLINLLGRTGGMESLNGIFVHKGNMVLDSINKTLGENSLKVTSAAQSEGDSGIAYIPINNLKSGSYYVVIADVKNGNNANGLYVGWGGGFGGSYTSATVNGDQFTTIWKKFSPTTVVSGNIDLAVQSISGKYGYFDSVRVYELNSNEYKSIDKLTAEQVNQYYPYVDSISPVRNPYAIAYGENLLPALEEQEWKNSEGTPIVNNRYSVDVSNTNKMILTYIDVVPGVTYTLSAVSNGSTGRIFVYNTTAAVALADTVGIGLISATFTVPSGVNAIEVRLLGTSSTSVNLSNIMLNVGNAVESFKVREDSMLALQTDLYADPVTGENADEVFEKDGQYFKKSHWKKIILDGSLNWSFSSDGNRIDYKKIYTIIPSITDEIFTTKYDGSLVPLADIDNTGSNYGPDRYYINIDSGILEYSIPAKDSGWGDNYTPTQQEIKAYFFGWKMFTDSQDALTNQYNGNGTKRWVKIGHTKTANIPVTDYVSDITMLNYGYVNFSKPYELVYYLTTPLTTPVIYEGFLRLLEGNNVVEVGSGFILRELSKPNMPNDNWFINQSGSPLLYKTTRILTIYKNNQQDNAWIIRNNGESITAQGGGDAYISVASNNYDPKAVYTVSYIANQRYIATNFIGSYAVNEKTIIKELITGLKQSNKRLSIIENTSVEQHRSNWITATLLNGWSGKIEYMKLSSGLVVFRGSITGGLTAVDTVLFTIPAGFGFQTQRPLELRLRTSNGSTDAVNSTIIIKNTGRVTIQNSWYNAGAWFDGISYMGEQ